MKQTAVERLELNMETLLMDGYKFNSEEAYNLYDQAKEMEKQQKDEFAIQFTDWCEDYYYPSSTKGIWYDNPDFDNAKQFFTKELLEIFKNK